MYRVCVSFRHSDEPYVAVVDEHNYVGEWLILVYPDGSTDAYPARNIVSVASQSHQVHAV